MLVLSSVCLAQEADEIIPPTENIFAGLDMLASDVKPAAPVSSTAATVKTVEPSRAQTGAAAHLAERAGAVTQCAQDGGERSGYHHRLPT